jgi:single-strand DNA-binding protein
VVTFSIATTTRRSDQERTTWYRVTAWGKLGEIVEQYVKKGSYLYVEGPIEMVEFTNREGHKDKALDVTAREVRLLDRRVEADERSAQAGHGSQGDWSPDENIPF